MSAVRFQVGWLGGLVVAALASGNPTAADLHPIGTVGGESPGIVTALFQDAAGFVWLGTPSGLAIYDGYTLTRFEHDVSDPGTISDNAIRAIYEDRTGNLWIGTNTGGLNLVDRATWRFRHFRHVSNDPSSLSHDSVNAILQDREGALWVATQNGLNRFDPTAGRFERFVADPDDPDALADGYVYALHEDATGILWVGTVNAGLHRFDRSRGRFSRVQLAPTGSEAHRESAFSIAEHPAGTLWVGTDAGLFRVPAAGGPPEAVALTPTAAPDATTVTDLAIGERGTVWAATWGDGVVEVDGSTGTVRSRRLGEPARGEKGNRVAALLVDRTGRLWVGTWGEGLFRSGGEAGPFRVIRAGPGGPGIGFDDVTAIDQAPDGTLWVGTWGRGIDRREPGTTVFHHDVNLGKGVDAGTILAIVAGGADAAWIGTPNGLYRFDATAGTARELVHDPRDQGSIGPGFVTAVLEDEDGRVWVGTGEGGLHRLRADGTSFDRFVHDPDDPGSISDDYVTVLHAGTDRMLWVGTRSGGINVCTPAPVRCRHSVPVSGDPSSLSHHFVTSIVEAADGTVWIGTGGGGLNRVVGRREDGSIVLARFTETDGLCDNDVMGIGADTDGSLWLSTRSGLCRYDPASAKIASFGIDEGLPSLEFNPRAAATGDTSLWFGSTGGLVEIPLGSPFPIARPSPVLVRSIHGLESPLQTDRAAWSVDAIEVPWGGFMSFEFVVLDFDRSRRHRYAYRLDGLSPRWIELGPRREVTFSNLDPGQYALHVRGRNGRGVEAEAPRPVEIRVVPPFWMTTWFRSTMLLAIAAAAIGGHTIRIAGLRRRNRQLQRLQEQRESALREARASESKLQDAYARLRHLTRRLEAAKEDERKRIARELHDEMGQALTAAKINLQILAMSEDTEARTDRFDDTVGLVDRMIFHVRQLSLDLRPPLLDELGLVVALRGYLDAQSQRSGIRFDVDVGGCSNRLPPETEITLFRAVQEAVTNVLRHAGATRVTVSVRSDAPWVVGTIHDDGRGFDVESTLESASEGAHLGLLGMRERVEMLGGMLEIGSALGKGTTIRIRVPFQAGEE